ncbi:hypothetical protein MPF_0561 [Methanohalophilus portucalensis FDF-1]|uniref:Uncharacterized protein n=1 Tax=Methanohalophilus portucalensis FDF-1 TaxID=523843 RepID=A0A1L9C5J8_9EURY|nr:hypothetical protein MPF_0561 [Methanohalophilus portucalensis FDF-1]
MGLYESILNFYIMSCIKKFRVYKLYAYYYIYMETY